jgi:hypothetical protein
LVRNGSYTLWRTNESDVDDAVSDLASAVCKGDRTVVAWCPTIGLYLPENDLLELEAGVRLSRWSPETRCVFLTRHHDQYLNDDMSSWASEAFIEIKAQVSALVDDAATATVTSVLDRSKWALQLTSTTRAVPDEGAVVSRGSSGWRGRTIRRGDMLMRTRTLRTVPVTRQTAEAAASLLSELAKARRSAPELDSALWHYGRACNASLPRDALLDSAIGLEMLLVPGPGESRYRFGRHGCVLIGNESSDPEKRLRQIYDLRSKAAHGDSAADSRLAEMAPRALWFLACAIRATVLLINSGELQVGESKGDIGKAVERLVLNPTFRSSRRVLLRNSGAGTVGSGYESELRVDGPGHLEKL